MNPCHLLIRVFGWGTMANLPSSPILYFFSLQKMIFLFLLCVWFCSYSRSWPPCPCHWPHPDRYHWLGSLPPSPHLPSLQTFNLLPHHPHVSYFSLYFFLLFFPFYSTTDYFFALSFFCLFFFLYFPPLIRTLPQLPSLQLFNLLPHHPHFSFLFQTFSSYHFLFSVIFPSPLVMTEAQPPSL